MVLALAVTLLSVSIQEPSGVPLFQRHAPLPDSSIASFGPTERWLYSFQGDWDQLIARAKKELKALGYREDADRIERLRQNLNEGPTWKAWGEYWLANSICLRQPGLMTQVGTLFADRIELVRDCKLERAKDSEDMGPLKAKDKGWITVIIARPKNIAKDGS